MQVQSAIDYVNGGSFVYKPGYVFFAQDYTYRMGGAILLTITFDALSTDRDDAREGYKKILEPLVTTFPIIVQDCKSDDDLLFQILRAIIDLETHEAREFLRKRPTYSAPFHPHRHDCMVKWAEKNGKVDANGEADISHDLNYGAYAPVPRSRAVDPETAVHTDVQVPDPRKVEAVRKIVQTTTK
jgi:hypothetical protein